VMMPILNGFVPDLVYSVITFGILVWLNWQLSFVVLLMLPVFALMRWRYFEGLRRRNEETRLANERMTGAATEYLGALRLVRVYGEEAQASGRLSESSEEVARARVELIRVSSSFGAFTYSAIKVLSLVVIAGGAILAIHGQITTGAVVAFVAGVPALVTPIQMFAHLSDQYFLGQEAYRSINELLSAPYVDDLRGTKRPAQLRGRIELNRVSFVHQGAEQPALDSITLNIAAGEKVALVGPSGAGKTTLANLILGLYCPSAGSIRIDGIAHDELDLRWLRRRSALVMQESILLSGTVAENLRFAKVDATDEELRRAAQLAHAEEFILKLPLGYETMIGERGATLSGGQRQRLAIARALLRDPIILILDEPTSALDYESERLIQAALANLAKGRTVLTIAHRLSTIRDADRIVCLSDGRIVEEGTYAALSAKNGYFSLLLAAQALSGPDRSTSPVTEPNQASS
jgi:ATP-binding cassette, subfamily B, bacterial